MNDTEEPDALGGAGGSSPGMTTLRRGLAVLRLMSLLGPEQSDGVSVTWLANQLDCHKSQVSRTLTTLAELGFVQRDHESGLFHMGWSSYMLSQSASSLVLIQLGGPMVRRLGDMTQELAHLMVPQGDQALTLQSVSPKGPGVQAVGVTGSLLPIHATASGRALLIDYELDSLRRIFASKLGVEDRSEALDAAEIEHLYSRIVAARSAGYLVTREELEPGLTAVGVPVRDASGRVIAAIGTAGPSARMEHKLPLCIKGSTAAAAQLTSALAQQRKRASRIRRNIAQG